MAYQTYRGCAQPGPELQILPDCFDNADAAKGFAAQKYSRGVAELSRLLRKQSDCSYRIVSSGPSES